MLDIKTRVALDQSLGKRETGEQVEEMAQECGDRFGALPVEAKNLLYAVKIKVMAARAGIESVYTEEGQITLRLLEGMQFTRQQREISLPEGVKMGTSQLRLNLKRLSGEWQEVLEEVVRRVGCGVV